MNPGNSNRLLLTDIKKNLILYSSKDGHKKEREQKLKGNTKISCKMSEVVLHTGIKTKTQFIPSSLDFKLYLLTIHFNLFSVWPYSVTIISSVYSIGVFICMRGD